MEEQKTLSFIPNYAIGFEERKFHSISWTYPDIEDVADCLKQLTYRFFFVSAFLMPNLGLIFY
ncbi:MAG: hypothetical protein ACOYLP_01700 [Flavobacterium sp.]|uniref:hypothetical protein n=1 Tax=Flavobacterium sp. TaxID=239 RepID=UPI003BC7FE94